MVNIWDIWLFDNANTCDFQHLASIEPKQIPKR